MQNFESILAASEKTLENIRGIFDKNKVNLKLKEIENTLQNEQFWKDKALVKKPLDKKKIFEEILNSYNDSQVEIKNLKDLFNLAYQEKNDEIIEDCNKKVEEVLNILKKLRLNVSYQTIMMILIFT